jgi:serine/threonine protein kinase
MLGEGGYGKVLLAQCKSPGKPHYKEECYATKVVKKYDIKVKGLIRQVMEEKDILRLVYGHPSVRCSRCLTMCSRKSKTLSTQSLVRWNGAAT